MRKQSETQEKQGGIIPSPICKPKPKQRKDQDKNQNKNDPVSSVGAKYSSASKRDADYEHAGVAIAIHRKWVHLTEEVREISGRSMTLILKTGSGKLALLSTYGPTADSEESSKTCIGKSSHRKWRLTKTTFG